jgi:hypothetical protein
MNHEQDGSSNRTLAPLLFLFISGLFTLPFLLKWSYIGVGDWELFVTMAAVPAKTVLHFGQFPFWNPYIGGGNILFAHPEVSVLSPFFPLILLFGPVAGLKLQILVAYFLGLYGTFLFARRMDLSVTGSYTATLIFQGNSYFALHYSIGHIPFTHFCFLPWFLYFLLEAEGNWKFIFAAAIAISLMILGNGAAVPLVYSAFFAGFFILIRAIQNKDWRPAKLYLGAMIIGVLVASVKFLPMYVYLSQAPWEGMSQDLVPLGLALEGFFSIDQAIFKTTGPDQYWGWHEYGAYLSPIVIILALSAVLTSFKKARLWLILALFFFIFGLGHFSDISPWALFTRLPGFSSIRAPSRAFQFVILSMSFLAAIGVDYWIKKLSNNVRSIKTLFALLIGLVAVGNFLVNLPALRSIEYKRPGQYHFAPEFRHEIGRKDNIYDLFLQNKGSLMAPWLSAYGPSRALVLPTNEVLMEYSPQGNLEVISRSYTPNRVTYEIKPSGSGTIIFGIGFDRGWRAVDGRRLYEDNGLVATAYNVSDIHLTLFYRPPYFYIGLIVSILAVGLSLAALFHTQTGNRFKAIFD